MKLKSTYQIMIFLFLLIFSAGLICIGQEKEASNYTLEEIYRIALEKSEDVKMAEENINQSKSQVTKARSMLMPKLSLNYSRTHYNKQVAFEMPGMEGIPGGAFEIFPQDTYTATLNLIQPIYLGGMQWASLEQAGTFHQLSKLSTAKTKQELLFAISALYFQIL